jgi:replicative DNA helicase
MNTNEITVLGCFLLAPETVDVAAGILSPNDFQDPALGKAFGIAVDLHSAGKPIDHVVLADAFKAAGILQDLGGISGIAKWAIEVPNAYHVREYCRLVKAESTRRNLKGLSVEFQRRADDPSTDPGDTAEWIGSRLLHFQSRVEDGPKPIAYFMDKAIERTRSVKDGEADPGLLTGLDGIDNAIGGMQPGELVILAARPSIGKSALAAQIGFNVGLSGRQSLFVSLEMQGTDLATRKLAEVLRIENSLLRNGHVNDDDIEEMIRYRDEVANVGFHVWPARSVTMQKLRAVAKVQAVTSGLDLLIVDYLGLVEPSDRRKPRYEQVSELSNQMKTLAMELQVPVLCLSQLNREAAGKGRDTAKGEAGKGEAAKPKLEHLRDSGKIEEDADIVLLLHRSDRKATDANLEVAKMRNGATGDISLTYDPEGCRFSGYQHRDTYEEFA